MVIVKMKTTENMYGRKMKKTTFQNTAVCAAIVNTATKENAMKIDNNFEYNTDIENILSSLFFDD